MDPPDPLCSQLRDEELSKESQESNWFSAPSALRVYGERICMNRMNQGPSLVSKACDVEWSMKNSLYQYVFTDG